MSQAIAEPGDRRQGLLAAWYEQCRRRGVETTHLAEPDARYLVEALVTAVGFGTETLDLGRAARSWGARFSSPVDALAAVTCLREVLTALTGAPGDLGAVVGDHADGVPRVVDQLMLESVDAAAGGLRASARIDPLTGCANRRALQEDLPRAVASARRSGLDVAVAMVDLDGLKRINDSQGHAAGDATLVALVGVLRATLRDVDHLYRSGGDEFVIVSPFTSALGARAAFRRAAAAGAPLFSWGVASIKTLGPQSPDDPERLLRAADADLYARRRARRRAVSVADRRRRARTLASVAVAAMVTASAAYGAASVVDSASPSLPLVAPPQDDQGQGVSPGRTPGGDAGTVGAPGSSAGSAPGSGPAAAAPTGGPAPSPKAGSAAGPASVIGDQTLTRLAAAVPVSTVVGELTSLVSTRTPLVSRLAARTGSYSSLGIPVDRRGSGASGPAALIGGRSGGRGGGTPEAGPMPEAGPTPTPGSPPGPTLNPGGATPADAGDNPGGNLGGRPGDGWGHAGGGGGSSAAGSGGIPTGPRGPSGHGGRWGSGGGAHGHRGS